MSGRPSSQDRNAHAGSGEALRHSHKIKIKIKQQFGIEMRLKTQVATDYFQIGAFCYIAFRHFEHLHVQDCQGRKAPTGHENKRNLVSLCHAMHQLIVRERIDRCWWSCLCVQRLLSNRC